MADFTKTAISQNAKREYISPIPTFERFNEVISAFESDTYMGITRTRSSETYKTKITYFDAKSNEKGYALFYAADQEQYENMSAFLSGDIASEAANGENHGGASTDSTANTWTVRFSCTNLVTVGDKEVEDLFSVTIGKDYMSINSFTYDETLTKLETWADTQVLLA